MDYDILYYKFLIYTACYILQFHQRVSLTSFFLSRYSNISSFFTKFFCIASSLYFIVTKFYRYCHACGIFVKAPREQATCEYFDLKYFRLLLHYALFNI